MSGLKKEEKKQSKMYREKKPHTHREHIYLDFLQNTGDVQIDQKEKKA